MKTRIIERLYPDGRVTFVVQQKHWLFFWLWVDASSNYSGCCPPIDELYSLEEATKAGWRFDGSKPIDIELMRTR